MENEKTFGPLAIIDLVALIVAFAALYFAGMLKFDRPVTVGNKAAVLGQSVDVPFQVLSPNGKERWEFGSRQEIKWQPKSSASKVSIFLTNETGQKLLRTLLLNTDNDGVEPWIVDVPAGTYKIQMQSCPGCSEGSNWDSSDYEFTVTSNDKAEIPETPLPANESLVIFSPKGGETYQPGEKVNIYWYGGYDSWNLTLTLVPVSMSNALSPSVIEDNVFNDGHYVWNIPTNIIKSDYYLRLECSNCKDAGSSIPAYSFNYFTLKNY